MRKLVLLGGPALMLALAAPAALAEERAKPGRALIDCDGGPQEAVFTNTENAARNLNGSGTIPSTTIFTNGSGEDLYLVTFSAETRHPGGGVLSVQAQASVNGGAFFDMNPDGPNVFHTGAQTETHTMTWCEIVGAGSGGTVDFRIVFSESGGGAAVIDDYTTSIERSN
jgi:hypothetical protein